MTGTLTIIDAAKGRAVARCADQYRSVTGLSRALVRILSVAWVGLNAVLYWAANPPDVTLIGSYNEGYTRVADARWPDRHNLGGCPRIGADRFVAPAKPALAPSMAVVARESGFETDFL